MKLSTLKNKIIECLTRDVRRSAEEAEAQEIAAHLELEGAKSKLEIAEAQARTLQAMDQRNHYTESLIESYRGIERTA